MKRLALLVGLAACQRETAPPVPTCAAITAHLADVMRQGLPQMSQLKSQDVATCEARALTPDQKRCLMAASTVEAIASCRGK